MERSRRDVGEQPRVNFVGRIILASLASLEVKLAVWRIMDEEPFIHLQKTRYDFFLSFFIGANAASI